PVAARGEEPAERKAAVPERVTVAELPQQPAASMATPLTVSYSPSTRTEPVKVYSVPSSALAPMGRASAR
ncbi:hypothetical protein FE89_30810, partial [Azospirillum brasilense]